LGTSAVLTGAASPDAISRSEASPEAETASYWPVFMRLTISSEVPATLVLTLQPVCVSNGVTQSTDLSLEPSSA
jgi:hypothetical protein